MGGETTGTPTSGGAEARSDDPVEWVDPSGRPREAVTQEEIDSVLDDPLLAPAEREARLRDLRQRVLDAESAGGEEAYAPLQVRIMDALGMVAEGGHDYDNGLRVEGGATVSDASPPASAATGVDAPGRPRTD